MSWRNVFGWSHEVHPEGTRFAYQGTYSAPPAFLRIDDGMQALGPFHSAHLDRIKLTTFDTILTAFTAFRIDASLVSAPGIDGVVRHLANVRSMPDNAAAFAAAAQRVRMSRLYFVVVDPLMDQSVFFVLVQYGNCFIHRDAPPVSSAQRILG